MKAEVRPDYAYPYCRIGEEKVKKTLHAAREKAVPDLKASALYPNTPKEPPEPVITRYALKCAFIEGRIGAAY